jgi:hypothetical protein
MDNHLRAKFFLNKRCIFDMIKMRMREYQSIDSTDLEFVEILQQLHPIFLSIGIDKKILPAIAKQVDIAPAAHYLRDRIAALGLPCFHR